MSNAIFPQLAGLGWGGNPVPNWSNQVQRSKNGAVTTLMNDLYPRWTFELSYEFLRDSVPPMPGAASNPENYTELDQIVGFYNARGGSFDDFLLDPGLLTSKYREGLVSGGPVVNVLGALAVGDGVTTTFYLARDAGGFLDEVQNPVGATVISVAGVPQTTGVTLGAAGVITFATAPVTGRAITWDGRWMWRVRFSEDTLDAKQFMKDLYELQSMKLEQNQL
jgi:uncharacterized protein (TIGR02217 family)